MPHVASGGERVRMETSEGTGKQTRWRWGRKRPKGPTPRGKTGRSSRSGGNTRGKIKTETAATNKGQWARGKSYLRAYSTRG